METTRTFLARLAEFFGCIQCEIEFGTGSDQNVFEAFLAETT